MKRLLNIDRPGGFPMCAETLGVLNENSMMLTALLAEIPLDRRQAVMFGRYLLVCDQDLRKKIVEAGAINAASLEQCKLEFQTENHSVYNNQGNEIADVWSSETAYIVDETSPGLQWRIFSFDEVFGLNCWNDLLPEFEAGLSTASISAGDILTIPILKDDYGNVVRANPDRLQLKFAIGAKIKAYGTSILSVPIPAGMPDWVRMEVDIETVTTNQGTHYAVPAYAYTLNGLLNVNVGLWLLQNSQISRPDEYWTHNMWIYVNKEVLL